MRILFVTWDGPEVNYVESLFLPIFAALQDKDILVDVLQFRWGDPNIAAAVEAECEKAGVRYQSVNIHRRPSAIGPFVSALLGSRQVRQAVRDLGSDRLMPLQPLEHVNGFTRPAINALAERARLEPCDRDSCSATPS